MDLKKLFSGIAVSAVAVAGLASASNFADTQGHWAETGGYIDSAIAEGAIDGSKSSFRPNDNITRVELTKMVSVYDLGGNEPTALDYLSDAGFSDVPSDAWFYDIVNYAAEEGIVGGYSDGTFRPGVAMNRAEAVKVITLALEVPSVDVTLPFSDVNSGDWFYPYVKNAYGNCVVKGRSATKFQPAQNITRAEAVKVFVESIDPSCGDTVTPTPEVSITPTPTDDETTPTPTPVITTDATSEVVLSSASPASRSVPQNAYQVPFLAIDVTASNDEDLLLTGLSIQHSGLGNADSVINVQAFEGVIPRGNDKDFSGEDDIAVLNLSADPIVIPAGSTKTVFVRADLNANDETAGEHSFALLNADAVTLVGADTGAVVPTTGTFPIVGSTMSVADITVGSLDVTLESVADTEVESGATGVEVARIKMDAGSEEDIYVRALTVEVEGTVDDGDLENFSVEVDGVRVSDVVAKASNDFITFNLTDVTAEGVFIADGSSEYFRVIADFTGPIDDFGTTTDDVLVALDSSSDIVAVGAKYGFGVQKTLGKDASGDGIDDADTNVRYIDIIGGDIQFSQSSTRTDVADDTDSVVFGTISIENFAGEAVEIDEKLYMRLKTNAGGDTANLEDIKLVNQANGTTVLGPVDGVDHQGSNEITLNIGEDFIIASGQTLELDIVADIKNNTPNGTEFWFELVMDDTSIQATGQSSDSTGFDIKPNSNLTTSVYTVKDAGLTVTANALESNTYVEGTTDVVWEGTLRANDIKDIKVDRLTFVNNGTASTSEVDEYTLLANVDGEWEVVESSVASEDAGSEFSFTDLRQLSSGDLIVEAGKEVEIRLVAKVSDTIGTSGRTLEVALNAGDSLTQEIEADGSTGDDLDFVTTGYVPTTGSEVTYTIVDNGTLTVALDTAKTPDTALLIAGDTEREIAVYEFDAQDESVEVDDLTVAIIDDTASSQAGVTGAYSEPLLTTTTSETVEGVVGTVDTATVTAGNTGNVAGSDVLSVSIDIDGDTGNGNETTYSYTVSATDTITTTLQALANQINGVSTDVDLDGIDDASDYDVNGTITGADADTDGIDDADDYDVNGTITGADVNQDGIQDAVLAPSNTVVRATVSGRTLSISELVASTIEFQGTPSVGFTGSSIEFTATEVASTTAVSQQTVITVGGTYVAGDLITVAFDVNVNGIATACTPVGATSASADDLSAIATALNGCTGVSATATTNSISIVVDKDEDFDGIDESEISNLSVSNNSAINRSGTLPSSDVDAIKAVYLFDEETLIGTFTGSPDANGEVRFTGLDWIVPAGEEKYLSVRVDLEDIDYGVSDATALSGHIFSAELRLDGQNVNGDDKSTITGYDSDEDLTVSNNGVSYTPAPSSSFVVANNKLVAAKLTADTTIGNGTKELIKFSLTDSGDSNNEAYLSTLTFDVNLNTAGGEVYGFAIPGTDAACTTADAASLDATGGSTNLSAYTAVASGDGFASGKILCTFTDEPVGTSETYVLEGTTENLVTDDDSLVTTLNINDPEVFTTATDGIVWIDGENGGNDDSTGATIQWIDLGESDESTSRIQNTLQ